MVKKQQHHYLVADCLVLRLALAPTLCILRRLRASFFLSASIPRLPTASQVVRIFALGGDPCWFLGRTDKFVL